MDESRGQALPQQAPTDSLTTGTVQTVTPENNFKNSSHKWVIVVGVIIGIIFVVAHIITLIKSNPQILSMLGIKTKTENTTTLVPTSVPEKVLPKSP